MFFCIAEYICSLIDKNLEDVPIDCSSCHENQEEILSLYQENENFAIANVSSQIVMGNYGEKTRLKGTIDFCKKIGYKKTWISILSWFIKRNVSIQSYNGFDVGLLICKIGSIDRHTIGINNCDVAMCNSIVQAELFNQQKTNFNIVLGLCVDHNTLLFSYFDAPVIVFVVKNRVWAYNSLGTVYLVDSYYGR